MSTATAAVAAPTRAETVRTLALMEARRYARHPLFLLGIALMAWFTLVITKDLAQDTADDTIGVVDATFLPALLLGLTGVVVGLQLTRSMSTSAESVEASPTDGVARTTALCLASLVPGVVTAVWLVWLYVVENVWPNYAEAAVSARDLAAIHAAGLVCAVGGPLFGVMVGRWTQFPGAGLLAVVVLYGWVMLSSGGLALPASRLASLAHLNAPFVGWISSDDSSHMNPWIAGGSPLWHLAYAALLCGVAATAAMLHDARGTQRSRLIRIFSAFAVLALVSLALAALADPTRTPL
ncbi:MAG: hypothetical protein ABIW49_11095 [Knoellia sp.]